MDPPQHNEHDLLDIGGLYASVGIGIIGTASLVSLTPAIFGSSLAAEISLLVLASAAGAFIAGAAVIAAVVLYQWHQHQISAKDCLPAK